jgi:hypothetical protein
MSCDDVGEIRKMPPLTGLTDVLLRVTTNISRLRCWAVGRETVRSKGSCLVHSRTLLRPGTGAVRSRIVESLPNPSPRFHFEAREGPSRGDGHRHAEGETVLEALL